MLESQIGKDIIEKLIRLCLRRKRNDRFLDLLKELCVCNNEAIPKNQDAITEVMLQDEIRKQQLFFTITTENDGNH